MATPPGADKAEVPDVFTPEGLRGATYRTAKPFKAGPRSNVSRKMLEGAWKRNRRIHYVQRAPRITIVVVADRGTSIIEVPREHGELLLKTAGELRMRDPDGQVLRRVQDVDDTARRAARVVIDTAQAWNDHLGPFYDVEGVRELLARDGQKVSRQAVSKRQGLLALRTGSGQVVYPQFQFQEDTPVRGLAPVLEALPEQLVSRWTVASWLVSPQRALQYATPMALLRDGSHRPVVAAARSWAQDLAA